MTFWLDGNSDVQKLRCPECGSDYLLVKTFVLDEAGPYAIAMSALHDHGSAEAWMDVIFGTFEEGVEDRRVTFGCRVGAVEGSSEPAATVVPAAVPYRDGPTFGDKLTRDEALAHSRLTDFWAVVDYLLEHEPSVNHHVYGHAPSTQRTWRWPRKRRP